MLKINHFSRWPQFLRLFNQTVSHFYDLDELYATSYVFHYGHILLPELVQLPIAIKSSPLLYSAVGVPKVGVGSPGEAAKH